MGVGPRDPVWALGGAYTPPKSPVGHSFLDVLGEEAGGRPLDGATLTVALDVVQAWAVLITVGFTLVLFLFLAFCVCARKDDGYDDYDLTQGITTVKVCHDGGENGLGSFPRLNGSNILKGSDEGSQASSRCTLKRELPAIPLSAQPDTAGPECNVERTQSQHSSDLYAAVGDVDGGAGLGKVIGGVQVLPAGAIGPDGRAAIIRDPTLTSPTEPTPPAPHPEAVSGDGAAGHPYAKVKKNHPYAHVKLPKKDHPYAKVIRDDSEDPETDTDNYDDPKAITKEKSPGWSSEGGYEPAPPVPEKRFDLEEEKTQGAAAPDHMMSSSVTSASSEKGPASPRSPHLSARPAASGSTPSPTSPAPSQSASTEIQAALAISGRTPANEEMPYMTPPLHHAGIEISSQQNFSGDSQDSRGYTSISVREPLAAIKAQTQAANANQTAGGQPGEGEGYYMTVSDDSADEMYACIYEGNRGVGSETYAQIEPRSTPPPPPPPMPSPPHAPSTPSPLSTRGESQPPPAPPSVDSLRHVVHSRQASSSSAASTVMGSPGAEKRGTRSPLPPLPQGDTSMYSGHSPQPPHSPPRAVAPVERPTQRALEEMYAKVMKKQRPGHARGDSCGGVGGGESDAGSGSSSRRGSVDVGGASRWGTHASSPPTTPRQSVDLGSMTRSLVETRNHEVVSSISRAKSYEKTGVWSTPAQHAQPNLPNPNYETIPQIPPTNFYSGSDPGYETVKNAEPAYASVERPEENYPGYETVKPTSDIESEPGYETLKHREYEPGYETVTGETKQAPSEPGYETVAHEKIREDYEPGYETVTHPRPDPGYEMVKGKPGSGFGDPGYEELKGAAHHPRTISENDPNYEQLKFTSRRSSEGEAEPGYEVVKKAEEAESTYELMRDYDTQHFPPYEKVVQPDVVPVQQAAAPVYATVQKGIDKKPKSPEGPVTSPPSAAPESSSDNFAPGTVGGTDALMRRGSKEDEKDMMLPLAKVEEQQEPLERRSPEGKSPKASPPGMKSPKASPTSSVKSHKGSPQTKSPRDSPTSKKSPRGSPPAMKSPTGSVKSSRSPSSPKPFVSSSPPTRSPPLPAKSPEGSPKEARSPPASSPPVKSPISSPKEVTSPICSPRQGKGPVSFQPLAKSPISSMGEKDSVAASGMDESSGEDSPPMMRSPSPDIDVPLDRKSPVSLPTVQSFTRESPPSERAPMTASGLDESSGKESPPMMRSPSPDDDVPLTRKSPVKESPPMMKSPSPDMDLPPPQKSPPPPQEERESPPMMKSPSPDMDLPPPVRKSPVSSPPAPSEEMPPMTQSPGPDFPPPASIPSPPQSPDKETPSNTRSPSPDSEAASPVKASPKPPSPPAQIPAVAAAVSSDSSSLSETGSPLVSLPPPPPLLADTGVEDKDTDKPSGIAEPEQIQEPSQNADVITNFGGSEAAQFSSLTSENIEESATTVTEEAETYPVQPEALGSEREGSPVAFSSLGSEDLPAPLAADDTLNHPQETVNPLYLLDEVNNGGLDYAPYNMQDAAPPPPPPSGPSSLCSELPPPPPMVMDMDDADAVFTNDLPPPLPESSPFMPRTSTLCDDTPPPPLVPPSDVEGLDEMLNLANMGSSSSGSTAGQPGSLHGNSEKDSDSPQEPSVMLMEGSVAGEELPPPPPLPEPPEPLEAKTEKDSDSEMDNSISSGYEGGFTAGGVTVTVNPMSDVEETSESPVSSLPPPPPPPAVSETPHVAPPSPVVVAAAVGANSAGSQSSSSGSGSQDTGSGSVESVVTVECVPPPDIPGPAPQQASDTSSSPENHNLEQHEQITPV